MKEENFPDEYREMWGPRKMDYFLVPSGLNDGTYAIHEVFEGQFYFVLIEDEDLHRGVCCRMLNAGVRTFPSVKVARRVILGD